MVSTAPTVVLLHGLGRTTASMWFIAQQIARAGFEVIRIGYKGTRQGIAASVAEVRSRLRALDPGLLHLVGHSMGGLIAAHIFRDPQELKIGRIVQIGSPNLGSPLAERVAGTWPFRRLCGPALDELSNLVRRQRRLPQIGSIAGTLSLPWVGLPRPHDGAVPLRSAWSGAGHRAAVSNLHTLLPVSPRVARLTIRFLRDGDFGDQK